MKMDTIDGWKGRISLELSRKTSKGWVIDFQKITFTFLYKKAFLQEKWNKITLRNAGWD